MSNVSGSNQGQNKSKWFKYGCLGCLGVFFAQLVVAVFCGGLMHLLGVKLPNDPPVVAKNEQEPRSTEVQTDKTAANKTSLDSVTVDGNTPLEKTEQLRNAIAKAIGKEGLSFSINNYAMDPSKIVFQVRFRIGDNLTNNMIRQSAKIDVHRILQLASESGLDLQEITTFGSFTLTDKLGNESLDVVAKANYSGVRIKKVNWRNFQFTDVYDIAENHWLHPAFRD